MNEATTTLTRAGFITVFCATFFIYWFLFL
jgi:hypothetical protein